MKEKKRNIVAYFELQPALRKDQFRLTILHA